METENMNGLEEEREDRQKHLCDGTGGARQLFQGLVTSLLSYLAFVKEGIVFTLSPTQNNTPPPQPHTHTHTPITSLPFTGIGSNGCVCFSSPISSRPVIYVPPSAQRHGGECDMVEVQGGGWR